MRKHLAILLFAAILICLFAGCKNGGETTDTTVGTEAATEPASTDDVSTQALTETSKSDYSAWSVALLADADNSDHPRNGILREACKSWCDARGASFSAYEATEQSTSALKALIDQAVEDGNRILILPGWTAADPIKDGLKKHPSVRFVLVDVTANFGKSYVFPENVCNVLFQEQVMGFMAGYAAVKLGYRHLSFVGAKNTAPVIRCGYGCVQGANAAALELDVEREIAVDFVYADTTAVSPAVTSYIEEMFRKKGVELCIACGENVEASAYEAAQRTGSGRVIGTGTDMMLFLNPDDEAEPVETIVASAVKNYSAAVETVLTDVIERNLWSSYAGQTVSLGVVTAENSEANYVRLTNDTKYDDGKFTIEDYGALTAALIAGDYVVSDETKTKPSVVIAVNYLGNIT